MVSIRKVSLPQIAPICYGLLVSSGLLFLEYLIATTNINGSHEAVLAWFVLVSTALSAAGSFGYWISNYGALSKKTSFALIVFPLFVFLLAHVIRNNYGGLGSA
jgi:hypothetical protein